MTKLAGLLFFLAGIIMLLSVVAAEIFYPTNYSISQNMISNLGATPPPNSIVYEPSATIFDTGLILAGILTIVGGLTLKKIFKGALVFLIILMGLGTAGVGLFPAFHLYAHPISALMAFGTGGLAAIFSAKFIRVPFSLLAIALGAVALIFLVVGLLAPAVVVPTLGRGGTERLVFYPILIWLLGFGGYLMGNDNVVKSTKLHR